MAYALLLAVAVLAGSLHLGQIPSEQLLYTRAAPRGSRTAPRTPGTASIIRGTIGVVAAVPGLFALIVFASFNNLLGGVVHGADGPVRAVAGAGAGLGAASGAVASARGSFVGGLVIAAKTGLGPQTRCGSLLLVESDRHVAAVRRCSPAQPSIVLLAMGQLPDGCCWGPYAEAAEQTALQKVVPLERQGRVFGFAQSGGAGGLAADGLPDQRRWRSSSSSRS